MPSIVHDGIKKFVTSYRVEFFSTLEAAPSEYELCDAQNNEEFYFSLCFRWHLMLRAKRGGFIHRGDLYIHTWELQSESRQRAHQHQRNLCISVSNFTAPYGVACTIAKFSGFSSSFLLLLFSSTASFYLFILLSLSLSLSLLSK